MQSSIEEIYLHDKLLAVIVRAEYDAPGVRFFTPSESPTQLAHIHCSSGDCIQPHIHNAIPREVQQTQEVLFIRAGKLRVDFYSERREYLQSRVLGRGDVIYLVAGGHGFKVLEEVQMIEVKQGPYVGEADRSRFPSVPDEQVILPPVSPRVRPPRYAPHASARP